MGEKRIFCDFFCTYFSFRELSTMAPRLIIHQRVKVFVAKFARAVPLSIPSLLTENHTFGAFSSPSPQRSFGVD
jgi:hypothetical protein